MKTVSFLMLGRAALAAAILVPAAACAKPAEQAASLDRETGMTKGAPKGVTLSAFVTRHEGKFMAGDTDGDGKVSRAEFLAAAKTGKTDPSMRFTRLDANSDGALDRSEIDAMLSRRFKRMDTSGDDVLSADERAAHRSVKAGDAANASES